MEGDGEDERYRYSVMAARRGGSAAGDASGGAIVSSEEAEGAFLCDRLYREAFCSTLPCSPRSPQPDHCEQRSRAPEDAAIFTRPL